MKLNWIGLWISAVMALMTLEANAQRQMERLGRGVVAMRTGTSSAYVSWRLLATDPQNIGFNVYRIVNGATNKLNSALITNTTDYADSSANFAYSNAWCVQPVVGTVTQALSAAWGLPAGVPTRQYLSIPLRDVGGPSPPYDVKFCWVGDLDGDGEYDFVVDRLSITGTNALNQYVQAYKRDGTFLWQADMGYNSTNQYTIEPGSSAISIGMGDCITVYDMDGDGRAEVMIRTANGVTITNAAGVRVASITAGNDITQYMSVFEGLTGVELARATIPNNYTSDGPLFGHMGIMYCDGLRPSVIYEGWNRVGSGSFNMNTTTWDYRNGVITQRWTWDRGSQNADDFHQIRVADVDHDGKDELIQGSYVIDDNGVLLFGTELVHGDRFHTTDMDPDRPGLETFAIQQDNPSMLGMALYDSATGRMIKKWYMTGVGDVGRGMALDFDPRSKGCEMFSTMGGIYNCRGELVTAVNPWPVEGLWWDGDILRETMDGNNWNSAPYVNSPYVNKINYTTGGISRLLTVYNQGMHQAYGARSAFWGDILGDWREEFIVVSNDYSSIALYTTTTAATNRIYCLMQNPAYRCQATCKGYYQASYPDYYLGNEMPPSVPAPISDARLVWRGDGTNVWDAGTTANWRTNWFWNSNTAPALAFNAGNTVLFDISGSNNTAIRLVGSLTPGAVTVYAPKAFTFSGTGSLDGTMKLTKAGKGALTFTGTNTYTGATLVAEGSLVVNGSLPSSPVTVRGGVWHDGRLCGSGFVGGGVRVEIAGGISPGNGTNSPGTLTLSNSLVLAGGVENQFDLTNTPAGPADLLRVAGNITLTGTNQFVFRLLATNLTPGLYPLITYSGTLAGTLSNQLIVGLDGMPVALTNPPGQIALLVKSMRPPATLTWSGGFNGNTWDLLASSNWFNSTARDQFNPGDVVRFNSMGESNLTVTLAGSLNSGGIIVDSATNYALGGGGVLMGTGGIAKSNTGTLTLSGKAHTFTGRTVIAGGTLSIASLGIGGEPSSIGAAGTNATNFVMAGGTLQLTGDDAYTDRAITLSSGTNTFDIPSSSVQMTLVNSLSGAGRLVKTGSGLLVLTAADSYTGGTTIKAGRILLGGATANSSGLGNGTVILEGGTLSMSDVQASETASWNLVVPTNATARLDVDGRCTLSGSLNGGGTLTVFTPYVRTDFSGNWSSFSNQINIITDSDGGDFRCNNSAGYPNAKINIGALASLQNRVGGTPTIPVGEISGATGSTISAPGGNNGIGVNWRVGGLNTSATFAGNTWNNVGFVKVGTGTWTWTGTNNHTSGTTVSNGTLLVMGNAAPATGVFVVAPAGTLGGTGIIGGATTVSGTLSPGSHAIGTLTFNNNLTLASGSTTVIEINRSTGAEDLVVVNGTLAHGGTLRVTNLAGTLVTGDTFTILNAAAHSGTFTALNLPALDSSHVWDTSALYTSGTLTVVAATPIEPQDLVWRGDGAASLWDIATTTNWINASNAASMFDNGDTVTFDDTGSNNVPVNLVSNVQPAAFTVNATKAYTLAGSGMMTGSNGIVKSGSGTFALANANTCSGPVVINAGTLKLLGLAHRWSFNGSLADSTGGQSASIVEVGANNATLTATNVTLAGGSRTTSDYVSLGSNALSPVDSPVTVELWARQNAVQNWARIFDFGASATENLFMSWSLGTLINTNRVEWKDAFTSTSNNVNMPYTLGVEHHIALVIEPRAGNNGTTRVSWYRAAATNTLLGAAVGSFDTSNTLLGFTQTTCWLGRSAYSSDSTASATYNEVRIWNRALSAADLQTLHAAGPDTTFASLALATGSALSTNATVSLTASGTVLENAGGQVQTLGSLSGVAGSLLRLSAGGVAAGNDNASTTFAGSISGTGGFTKQGTGTLVLEGTRTFTGPLTVSAGSLFVNGTGASATGAVSVASGATLGGTGTLGGATAVAGTLAPGQNGIGRLAFSRAITMTGGSTNRFEIDKASMTHDSISASSILFGGTLSVANLGGTLESGDNYELFSATSRSGSFSAMTLPALGPGLDWNTTRLVSEGRIWVVATTSPAFGGSSIVDGQLCLSGAGGTPGWPYCVLTATNAAMPLAQWTPVITNLFDAGGAFSFTNAIGIHDQQFYRIQVP